MRNDLSAEIKSDLVNYSSAIDGQAYLLLGESATGDRPTRSYMYRASSSATVDGELVLAATGMGGVGRFLKNALFVAGTGLSLNLTTDTVTNTITNTNQLTNGAGFITGINSSAVTTALGYTPVNPNGTGAQYIAGDGSKVTFPAIPAAFSINNSPGRSLVSVANAANGYQISPTRNVFVNYVVTVGVTATIAASSSGTVVLEIAATNSSTPGDWTEISRFTNGQSLSLAVALQSVQTIAGNLNAMIPAGYYVRQRTINNSGTPSFTAGVQQEVLL